MGTGKNAVLFSSFVTGNSYEERKIHTLGFGETLVTIQSVSVTSGSTLSHRLRGFPDVADAPTLTYPLRANGADITDITVGSGYYAQYSISDAYDEIGIAVKNTTSNKSGRVTVVVSRKRRQ